MADIAAVIRVGIGGWTYAPWRGAFYPEGLPHDHELAYASASLTSIEINGTFYRHQSPESFASWRRGTPDSFVFAVKAHMATTHGRDPAAAGPAIARFLASGIEELGPKLGPILWQFPPAKRFDPAAFQAFLSALPPTLNGQRLHHAVEARHSSFEDSAWPALARAHNVAVVIIDSDKQALHCDLSADFVCARLQRNDVAAPEGYDAGALDGWAARAKDWASAPHLRPCFMYFISGDKQCALDAATAFLRRL